MVMSEGICLNNQTTSNLSKYLQGFPPDAKVVIHHQDRDGNFVTFDCQIACNIEHQTKENKAILILGMPTD